jgi:hypothetical protein
MLTLEKESVLNEEQHWLKRVYSNIVSNLIQKTIRSTLEFDPFMLKFMGADTTQYNKFMYQALLEVTSYFWASKGGRGALLEKIIASLGGPYSSHNLSLSRLINIISSKNNSSKRSDQDRLEWLIKTDIKKMKFDMVNIINDTLIIFELKNRVDSGGTAARQEALTKLITLCKTIEDEKRIFVHNSIEYDFEETLLLLGISKMEMHMGLLYNLHGKEATIADDKEDGFFSSSKTHLKKHANENHLAAEVTLDENTLRLYLRKGKLLVSVGMSYGNEVVNSFTGKQLSLDTIMEKVFSKSWDDIWLVFNLAISQRAMLLEYKKNQITEIKRLKENDEEFNTIYKKFCDKPSDPIILRDIVNSLRSKADFSHIPEISRDDTHLANCLYAFTSYSISKSIISKSKVKPK